MQSISARQSLGTNCRFRISCLALCACCIFNLGYDNRAAAQDFSFRDAAAKLSPANLFKRSEPQVNPTESSAAKSVAQPTELKVIDRAAAQRMPAHERERYPVQPASYQQPAPRVYQTPPANVPTAEGYRTDYPPHNNLGNFAPGFSPGYPGGYDPNYYPQQAPHYYPQQVPSNNPPGSMMDQPQLLDQPTLMDQPRLMDQTMMAPAQESSSVLYPPRSLVDDRSTSQPPASSAVFPQSYENYPPDTAGQFGIYANEQYPAGYETGYDPNAGRGYLQNGSGLQGRRLSANPQTATERALELRAENERLKDAVSRTELELENRTKELAAARTAYSNKEEELVRTLNRVNDLNAQLMRLTSELKVAMQQKQDIQRRADEQLKAIETSLDGVLMNSISNNGERK